MRNLQADRRPEESHLKGLIAYLTVFPRATLAIAVFVAASAVVGYWPYGPLNALAGSIASLLLAAGLKVALVLFVHDRIFADSPRPLAALFFIPACSVLALILASPAIDLHRASLG